jgi:hypothetical protein
MCDVCVQLNKHKEQQIKAAASKSTTTSSTPKHHSIFSAFQKQTECRAIVASTETAIDDSLRASVTSIVTLLQTAQAPLAALKF